MKVTFLVKQVIRISAAMFVTSVGIVLMMKSGLGLNPWWTFTSSISQLTGISLGLIVRLMSLLLILFALLLGKKPGITTILDMFLLGFYIDLINSISIEYLQSFSIKLICSVLGLLIFCIGIFLTVRVGQGAGPKDSFTFAIMKKINKNMTTVKLAFEGTTFFIGILLGGPFGFGTIIATLFTGSILEFLFKKFKYNPVA